MHLLFLGAFLFGLLLAVFAMLHGVERRPRSALSGAAAAAPSGTPAVEGNAAVPAARLNLPLLAGFATVFGATGYLLTRYSTLSSLPRVGLAALVGALGALAAVALVAKWAVPGAAQDVEDPRYLLQGHLARVTFPIGEEGGEIVYEVDGIRHVARAASLDGGPVPADSEVVIERIEDGVAYVERWAVVEERL